MFSSAATYDIDVETFGIWRHKDILTSCTRVLHSLVYDNFFLHLSVTRKFLSGMQGISKQPYWAYNSCFFLFWEKMFFLAGVIELIHNDISLVASSSSMKAFVISSLCLATARSDETISVEIRSFNQDKLQWRFRPCYERYTYGTTDYEDSIYSLGYLNRCFSSRYLDISKEAFLGSKAPNPKVLSLEGERDHCWRFKIKTALWCWVSAAARDYHLSRKSRDLTR